MAPKKKRCWVTGCGWFLEEHPLLQFGCCRLIFFSPKSFSPFQFHRSCFGGELFVLEALGGERRKSVEPGLIFLSKVKGEGVFF